MSTLEVVCARCDKRFGVRSEFAGKSTRCPGCSAPITIGAATRPGPPRDESPERPRPKPRERDDDDEPRRPTANWKPVDSALGREQIAVLFVLFIFIASIIDVFVAFTIGSHGPDVFVQVFMVLLVVGPAIVAGVFGLAARLSALRAPAECYSKGATVSSLLCAFAALASLIMFGIAILVSIDQHRPSELPMMVAMGGLVLSTLAAVATFLGFVTQVGIARKSGDVARAVGRTAVTACICLCGMIAIAILYTLFSEFDEPTPSYYGQYGNYNSYYRDDSPFYRFVLGILLPLSFGVVLILYHRLLAAARRSIRGEAERRYED
jgi:DNA-directed RNA polymerase subunit RPC12/RpoP